MTALTIYRIRVTVILLVLLNCQGSLLAQLTAGFSATPLSGCTPMVIQFNDLSTGNPTQWRWDLGNGVISTLKNPSATYFNPGTYHIKLVVRNAAGADSLVKQNYITVHPNPVVGFAVSDTAGCFPLNVQFTNQTTTASGTLTSYSWDFGDGTTSNLQHPQHNYLAAGNYTVTLRVTNSFGCVQTISKNQLVKVSAGVKAAFDQNDPATCTAPVSMRFTNQSSGPGILSYQWNFGDGNSSNLQHPQHTYNAPGSYSVTLITTSNLGCRDTLHKPNLLSIGTLNPGFSFADKTCEGSGIQFTNTSTPAPGSVTWYFGDGSFSNEINPLKTYNTPGTFTVKLVNNYGGCEDSISRQVTVMPKPASSFNADITAGCKIPMQVTFTSTSTGAVQYLWDFGDGNIATTNNPTHTYTQTGSYTVKLVTTNSNGCSDTVTRVNYIQIALPEIILNNVPVFGCAPLTVRPTVTITSNEPITGYLWDFGNGNTSTAINPAYTYTTTGTYDISLTVSTANGCTGKMVYNNAVRAGTKPKANFSINPKEVCAMQPVTFTDLSTGNPDQWFWDFGDGTTSTAKNPVHEYQDTGWLHVRLVAVNNSCADTFLVTNAVYIKPPIAGFNYNQSCADKYTVQFNDASVGAETYFWQFGDGTTSALKDPVHQYTNKGDFEVSLTVTNGSCTQTTTQWVKVIDEAAVFSADTSEICKGSTIHFSAPGINAANIANWYWDFGDGNSASSASAADHIYQAAGNYLVTLTITDLLGCVSATALPIKVFGPVADFIANAPAACIENPVIEFTDRSTSDGVHPIQKWLWNYGDGNLDSNATIPNVHTYTQTGAYTVSLTVTDDYGCSHTASRPGMVVIAKPEADFISADTVTCIGKPVLFQNRSNGYDPVYNWQFGDGQSSAIQNPVHNYTAVGIYDVQLLVTDRYGCKDTISKPAYIDISYPKALFTVSDSTSSCPPLLVDFTNHSEYYTSLRWDFGDGNTSDLTNASHYYTSPGTYFATLTVTGPGGCSEVYTQKIVVKGPSGSFSYEPVAGCNPLTVTFRATTQSRLRFIWDFSDGNTLSTTDSIVTHTYTVPGDYIPKMILIDAGGCSVPVLGDDTIKVKDVKVDFTIDKHAICDQGTVSFTSAVETNDLVTAYQWDFGDGSQADVPDPTHNYTAPGIYSVSLRVTTAQGCTDQKIYQDTIHVYPSPLLTLAGDSAACIPATINMKADVSRGDTSSFTWLWNMGNGNTYTTQFPPAQTYTQPGTYLVKVDVKDDKGCTISRQKPVAVFELPNVSAGPDLIICHGDSKQLNPSGAATYTWQPAPGLSCTQCAMPTISPLSNQQYIVTGTSVNGCINTDTLKVTVRQPFELSVEPGDSICVGESVQLRAAGADKYSWSPATGLNKANIPDPVAKPLTTTSYMVTATDNDNCFQQSATVLVHVTPLPKVDAGPDATISAGSSYQMKPVYSPDVVSWRWTPAGMLNCATCPEPVASPKAETKFFVEARNSAGCFSVDHMTINVTCNGSNVFLPNSFSPNRDGVNDIFYPRGSGLANIKSLRVFNRWGELVFERLNFNANDAGAGWDGTYKGNPLSTDVYVYACEIVCDNNQVLVYKGDVSLMR